MANEELMALFKSIYDCRECRQSSTAFATQCGGLERPPDIVHGPRRPDLLVVSINPKFVPTAPILGSDECLAARLNHTRDPRIPDPYLDALQSVLPAGFAWGNVESGTVSNTRAFKCATKSGGPPWLASLCTTKFLEMKLLEGSRGANHERCRRHLEAQDR